MTWPVIRLADLADGTGAFVDGPFGSNLKASEYAEAGVPIIRLQNIRPNAFLSKDIKFVTAEKANQLARHNYRPGDLVIAKLGEPCGMTCVLPEQAGRGVIVADVVRFRGREVNHQFLSYCLNSELGRRQFARMAKGATRQRVNLADIKEMAVPVPPMDEQRRVVDLLSRAENIVRMRREAEARAKEIVPALFLDMFGDPARNERRWEVALFRDSGTLDRGRSRHRPRDATHLYGGPYPFIQTGDVTRSCGAITTYSQTYSDAGLAQSKLWPTGTLCITIAANIAETGILQFDACFPDSVVGFLPGARVRTDYIQQWLGFLRPTLAAQAPQAAQKNINLAILGNLRVPIPPLVLQDAFAERVSQVRSVVATQRFATNAADQAFQSLLAGVFQE